jgi:hypothetical protein
MGKALSFHLRKVCCWQQGQLQMRPSGSDIYDSFVAFKANLAAVRCLIDGAIQQCGRNCIIGEILNSGLSRCGFQSRILSLNENLWSQIWVSLVKGHRVARRFGLGPGLPSCQRLAV